MFFLIMFYLTQPNPNLPYPTQPELTRPTNRQSPTMLPENVLTLRTPLYPTVPHLATLIIIKIFAPLSILSEDEWGDLECPYKAGQ